MAYASKTVQLAARQARRPAAKWAALATALFFACSIARSDAKIQTGSSTLIGASRISGSWYATASHTTSGADALRSAVADAHIAGVVASAQQLLTKPKLDDAGMTPEHVSALHIDTKIHARRVAEYATPEVRFTGDLAPGQRRTLRKGVPAIAWVTERLTLWNDIVVSRQVIAREVVTQAQRGVTLVGTPRTLAQFRAAFPNRTFATAMTMVATAYTADSATAYPTGYTATGMLARQGVVAVDPRVIPLGTTLFVPGYGLAIAADTGGAIIGNRIDLCMNSYGDAMSFGRQTVQVYIIKQ